MDPMTLSILVSAVLTLGSYAYNEANMAAGSKIRNKLRPLANKIYNMIKDNQDLMDSLATAYNNKNTSLINSLMTSAGFGPQATKIKEEIMKSTDEYIQKKKDINNENKKLENAYNQVIEASNYTGAGIAANVSANKAYEAVNQQINGGLNTNE